MTVTFLTWIFDSAKPWRRVYSDEAKEIFKDFVVDAVDGFDFESLQLDCHSPFVSGQAGNGDALRYVGPDECRENDSEAEMLAERTASFLCHCKTFGCDSELSWLVQKLNNKSLEAQPGVYRCFLLPLLREVMTKLKNRSIAVHEAPFQSFFQQILSSYVVRFVKAEPQTFKDWARPNVACVCRDCRTLNNFLSSPTAESRRFARKKERRRHLGWALPSSGFEFEEDKRPLIITKLQLDYVCWNHPNDDHKKWLKRVDKARKILAEFPSELLKDLLLDLHEPITSASVNEIASKNDRIKSPFSSRQEHRRIDQLLVTLQEEDLINFSD
jgi:hypothetical protein